MNVKAFFNCIIILSLLGVFVGCSDDSLDLQRKVSVSYNNESMPLLTRASDQSFDTDWEKMDSIILTNGREISLPWGENALSSHRTSFLQDMKKEDGWFLVTHNLYENPSVTSNNWKITFYNQASGDLKIYSFCPIPVNQSNNAFWRISFDKNEGWLNGLQEVCVPNSKQMSDKYIWRTSVQPNETNTFVSQGWNVIVIPNLTYDPNASDNTIEIDSYSTEMTYLEGFGTTSGSIDGKIITYGETSSEITSKVASYVGDGAKDWVTSHMSSASEIISSGIGGLVKFGVQKIIGSLFGWSSKPSYTEQTVRLNLKADSKFDAKLITFKGTGIPGAKIKLNKTMAELGNWNLSDNPTVYIHPVGVLKHTILSDEADYTYVASGNFKVDIVFNPQLRSRIKAYQVQCYPVRYVPKNGNIAVLPQLPAEFREAFSYGSIGSLEPVVALKSSSSYNALIYSDDDYSIYDSKALGYATYSNIKKKHGAPSGSTAQYKYIYGPSNSDICHGGDVKFDCTYNYVKVYVNMLVEFEDKMHTVISSRTYRPKFEWDPSYVSRYSSLTMSTLQSSAVNDPILENI